MAYVIRFTDPDRSPSLYLVDTRFMYGFTDDVDEAIVYDTREDARAALQNAYPATLIPYCEVVAYDPWTMT